jgi:hypothetical protein
VDETEGMYVVNGSPKTYENHVGNLSKNHYSDWSRPVPYTDLQYHAKSGFETGRDQSKDHEKSLDEKLSEDEQESLFGQWIEQVKSEALKPSNRPGRRFISERVCRGRNVTVTPSEMDYLLNQWRERAVSGGVLMLNPLAGNGKGVAKYILRKN